MPRPVVHSSFSTSLHALVASVLARHKSELQGAKPDPQEPQEDGNETREHRLLPLAHQGPLWQVLSLAVVVSPQELTQIFGELYKRHAKHLPVTDLSGS